MTRRRIDSDENGGTTLDAHGNSRACRTAQITHEHTPLACHTQTAIPITGGAWRVPFVRYQATFTRTP